MVRKLLVAGAVVAGVIALGAGSAFAHVEIEREGQVGSDGTVEATLTVPNERDDAGTVKVELVFPDTPAVSDAQATEVAGWTATVEKDDEGDVESVIWTGGPIEGEEEVQLPLTLGPVPDGTEEIDFDALQTYDDGDEVRWIEATPEGGEEPEHPAPVLLITGEASAHDDAEGHDDGMSTGVIVAIVVGVVVVLGLLGWLLSRSRRNPGSPTV
jgi:periplasmic copper chaperone A